MIKYIFTGIFVLIVAYAIYKVHKVNKQYIDLNYRYCDDCKYKLQPNKCKNNKVLRHKDGTPQVAYCEHKVKVTRNLRRRNVR